MVLSYNTGFAKEEITSFVAARYGLFNTAEKYGISCDAKQALVCST
jgi:hypothetical protein